MRNFTTECTIKNINNIHKIYVSFILIVIVFHSYLISEIALSVADNGS